MSVLKNRTLVLNYRTCNCGGYLNDHKKLDHALDCPISRSSVIKVSLRLGVAVSKEITSFPFIAEDIFTYGDNK